VPTPDPALKPLDRWVGTWRSLEGHLVDSSENNIKGQATFKWLPGGFFIEQRITLDFYGDGDLQRGADWLRSRNQYLPLYRLQCCLHSRKIATGTCSPLSALSSTLTSRRSSVRHEGALSRLGPIKGNPWIETTG
jgi:hypothetical protein